MLDALEIIKGGLSEKIESHLFEEISSYFSEIPSEIDCLSTHSLPKDCEIESINIGSIDSKEIIVNGEGTIDIRLQHGSDGDVYYEKLPFTFVFNFNVSNLSDYKLIKCSVDAENYYR